MCRMNSTWLINLEELGKESRMMNYLLLKTNIFKSPVIQPLLYCKRLGLSIRVYLVGRLPDFGLEDKWREYEHYHHPHNSHQSI